MRARAGLGRLLPALLGGVLAGCAGVSYYAQSVRGQLALMAASTPVEEVIADPATTQAVRDRLAQLPALRRFAVDELGLADSRSYRLYARVQGEALVWSLVATPADSLTPRQWCYPVIGCASYRGYFREEAARAQADELEREGWDVAIDPVPAYSTLGWFSDPLPSTVIRWPMADIAGLVFHELAHETLYLPGDTAFSEAYATTVEREGVRRWLARFGSAAEIHADMLRGQRRQAFRQLLAQTRGELAELYAEPVGREALTARKQAVFGRLRERYAALRDDWGGYAGYDRWFDRPLNNAHLASVDSYQQLVPAFALLLQRAGGEMAAFHAACRAVAALQAGPRQALFDRLLREAGGERLAAAPASGINAAPGGAAD